MVRVIFILVCKNYRPTSTRTTLNRPSTIGVAKYGVVALVGQPTVLPHSRLSSN